MSARYQELAGRLDWVRRLRAQVDELGADSELASDLALLAADAEITTLNEYSCTGLLLQFTGKSSR